jgi:hypothetical protein
MSVKVDKEETKEKSEYSTGKLTQEQKEQFTQLIKKYENIFVKDKNELGKCGFVKHKINTGNAKPIKLPKYRAVGKRKKIIKEEIDKMLKKGVIKKSTSPWASPVVLVPKKNGKIRFCIDYRDLNKITEKDVYPLPKIDDMLDTFNGSKWFTSIDLASGYWQIEMDEEDAKKTAFITGEGLYEWKVMPFGLTNAPGTFQRMMHEVLGDLIYTKAPVYIDDVNIHSKTFTQHLQDIDEVFSKIQKAGLKLRLDKCKFCFGEIEFLGYVIGRDGIKTDEKKIEKIKNYPKPRTVTELKGFLGLASYYRRFIKDFSSIAKPLNDLQKDLEYKKDVKQKIQNQSIEITKKWKEDQEKSFETLKEKLCTTPVLAYPDFEKDFILHTDASGFALGAVLSQIGEDKKEHPIYYASKSLTKAEQNYSTTELECYAVVWAVEKFYQYLEGNNFKIITDHYALKWLKNNALKGRRARWILKLQPYMNSMEIIHKEGRKHKNADALSRLRSTQNLIKRALETNSISSNSNGIKQKSKSKFSS